MEECCFVVASCTSVIGDSSLGDSKTINPQVPVNQTIEVGDRVLRLYRNTTMSYGDKIYEISKEDNQQLAGFLWHYLKQRDEPLFPFEFFGMIRSFIKSSGPSIDEEKLALSDEYIDKTVDNLRLEDLSAIITRLPVNSRATLFHIFKLIDKVQLQTPLLTPLGISNVVTPILIRPANSAFMSIRHRRGVVYIRLAVVAFIEQFEKLEAVFSSTDEATQIPLTVSNSVENLESPVKKDPIPTITIPELTVQTVHESSTEHRALVSKLLRNVCKTENLMSCLDHVKAQSGHSSIKPKKLEIPIMRSYSEGTLVRNKSPEKSITKRLDNMSIHIENNNKHEESKEKQISYFESLEFKKRSIKRKLKEFDEKYIKENGRKPTRMEKEPMRQLYESYNVVKRKLGVLSGLENSKLKSKTNIAFSPRSFDVLKVEKRNLQSKLRHFEKTFEASNGRPVNSPRDIEGLEDEYKRYKYLREVLAASPDSVYMSSTNMS